MSKGFGFCALFLLFSQALLASPTGSITGFVKDPTGADGSNFRSWRRQRIHWLRRMPVSKSPSSMLWFR